MMARFRTAASAVILLFGSTFLWFMPSFLGTGTTRARGHLVGRPGTGPRRRGVFAGAAWRLDKARRWWEPLAIGGLVLDMVVLLLWWIPVSAIGGVRNVVANLALHAAGIAVVLLVLLAPSLARRLDRLLAVYSAGPA